MSVCRYIQAWDRRHLQNIHGTPVPSGGIAKPTEETQQKSQTIPCKRVLKLHSGLLGTHMSIHPASWKPAAEYISYSRSKAWFPEANGMAMG